MAWTVLSTVDDLYADLPVVVTSKIPIQQLEKNIADAQLDIEDDLSRVVKWDKIRLLTTVPRTLRRLSRYRSAALTLVRVWNDDATVMSVSVDAATGEEETGSGILRFFRGAYKDLLEDIRHGRVVLLNEDDDEFERDEVRRPGVARVI